MDSPVYHIESSRLMVAIERAMALSSAVYKIEELLRDSLESHDLSFLPKSSLIIDHGLVVGKHYRVRHANDVAGLRRFAGDVIRDGSTKASEGYLLWLYEVEEWHESVRAYFNGFHRWELLDYYKRLIVSLQYLDIEHLALTSDAVIDVAQCIKYFNNRLIDEAIRDPNALVKTLREKGKEWHGDTWLDVPNDSE